MSEIVIKVENLSKLYRLGEVGTGTVSHDLNRWFAKMRGRQDPFAIVGQVNDRTKKAESDYVWALKDIDFEVERGEVLGIIGKNGAGKSTLLKLLSQITAPTTGEIKAKGRIAALLEVGTGMHPEMTARENIYLNGAILGMRKNEIKSKFDEIIEFSGCAMYVDTPIKRFSSGMRVRLGFAVAAFLEPEILIVDEVLAVGDAEFQKKAIGKMKDISSQGSRTVLFVSHNMASVKSLCTKGIFLENGGISLAGNIDECVSYYVKGGKSNGLSECKMFDSENKVTSEELELISIGIKAKNKNYGDSMHMDEALELIVKYKKKVASCYLDINMQVKGSDGNFIFTSSTANSTVESNMDKVGVFEYKVYLPANFFNTETFFFNLLMVKNSRDVVIRENDILSMTILNKKENLGAWMGKSRGALKPLFEWEVKQIEKI